MGKLSILTDINIIWKGQYSTSRKADISINRNTDYASFSLSAMGNGWAGATGLVGEIARPAEVTIWTDSGIYILDVDKDYLPNRVNLLNKTTSSRRVFTLYTIPDSNSLRVFLANAPIGAGQGGNCCNS